MCVDYNIYLLNFQNHAFTCEYVNSFFSNSLLPVITKPTRVQHNSATLKDHIHISNSGCNYIAGIPINSITDHFPTYYIEPFDIFPSPNNLIRTRIINKETIPGFVKLLKNHDFSNIINQKNPVQAFDDFFPPLRKPGTWLSQRWK